MDDNHFILIGDITDIPPHNHQEYLKILKTLISSCSHKYKSSLHSPYSLTIDHEFMGIPSSLKTAIDSLFYFEETMKDWNILFSLSYVVHLGEISTSLNKKTSIRLMGQGISQAREMLITKKRSHPRILFHIRPKKLCEQLNRLFMVLDSLISGWNQKDYPLISEMLKNENNEEVAIKYRKNRSQIWKRRKTLKISEYKALKQVILEMV